MPYGDWISLIVALWISFFGAVYATWYFVYQYYHQGVAEIYAVIGLVGLSYVVSFLSFYVLEYVLLIFLWPGNNVMPVLPADEAVVTVKASHVTFMGLISYAAYKYFGRKQQQPAQASAEGKTETTVVEPTIVNSLE